MTLYNCIVERKITANSYVALCLLGIYIDDLKLSVALQISYIIYLKTLFSCIHECAK